MKKIFSLVFALALVFIFVGCSNVKEQNYFDAKVLQVYESSILVECIESENNSIAAGTKISVGLNQLSKDEIPIINVGDTVKIVHDGTVLESYPLQLHKVIEITVI